MEDDFCFNKDSLKRLKSLKVILESKEKNLDILFLDYLIDIPLFKCICLEKKKKSLENLSSDKIFMIQNIFIMHLLLVFSLKSLLPFIFINY